MLRRTRIVVVLVIFALCGYAAVASSQTTNISEVASLHVDNHHGLVLNEQGTAHGSIKATIYIQLTVRSTRTVTAQIQIYPSGGLMRGNATAKYSVIGGYADFNGTMNVTSGSGRYSRAHGNGLSFHGKIARTNDAVTVYMSGPLAY